MLRLSQFVLCHEIALRGSPDDSREDPEFSNFPPVQPSSTTTRISLLPQVRFIRRSARIATHGECDGQADTEAVLDELKGLIDQMGWTFRRGRQRYYNNMHESVNEHAEEKAAKVSLPDQDREFAAGQIVDRRRSEGDREVKDDSQHSGLQAAAKRRHPQHAAGNELWNEDGLLRTVDGDGVHQIRHSDNQATDEDGRNRAAVRDPRTYQGTVHRVCHRQPPIRVSLSSEPFPFHRLAR